MNYGHDIRAGNAAMGGPMSSPSMAGIVPHGPRVEKTPRSIQELSVSAYSYSGQLLAQFAELLERLEGSVTPKSNDQTSPMMTITGNLETALSNLEVIEKQLSALRMKLFS